MLAGPWGDALDQQVWATQRGCQKEPQVTGALSQMKFGGPGQCLRSARLPAGAILPPRHPRRGDKPQHGLPGCL